MTDSCLKPGCKFCSTCSMLPDICWVVRRATATRSPVLRGKNDSTQYLTDQQNGVNVVIIRQLACFQRTIVKKKLQCIWSSNVIQKARPSQNWFNRISRPILGLIITTEKKFKGIVHFFSIQRTWALTRPRSVRVVNMMISDNLWSQTTCQKCAHVCGRGPWVAMYLFTMATEGISIYKAKEKSYVKFAFTTHVLF